MFSHYLEQWYGGWHWCCTSTRRILSSHHYSRQWLTCTRTAQCGLVHGTSYSTIANNCGSFTNNYFLKKYNYCLQNEYFTKTVSLKYYYRNLLWNLLTSWSMTSGSAGMFNIQASRGAWPTGVTGLPYKVTVSCNGLASTMTSHDITIRCKVV